MFIHYDHKLYRYQKDKKTAISQFVARQDGNDVSKTNLIHYAHKLYHARLTFWFMSREGQSIFCNMNIVPTFDQREFWAKIHNVR